MNYLDRARTFLGHAQDAYNYDEPFHGDVSMDLANRALLLHGAEDRDPIIADNHGEIAVMHDEGDPRFLDDYHSLDEPDGVLQSYDESQHPRGYHGRWSATGGATRATFAKAPHVLRMRHEMRHARALSGEDRKAHGFRERMAVRKEGYHKHMANVHTELADHHSKLSRDARLTGEERQMHREFAQTHKLAAKQHRDVATAVRTKKLQGVAARQKPSFNAGMSAKSVRETDAEKGTKYFSDEARASRVAEKLANNRAKDVHYGEWRGDLRTHDSVYHIANRGLTYGDHPEARRALSDHVIEKGVRGLAGAVALHLAGQDRETEHIAREAARSDQEARDARRREAPDHNLPGFRDFMNNRNV